MDVKYPVDSFTEAQKAFFYSFVRNVFFCGGFGSGKTFVACNKGIFLSQIHAGLPGIIVSPTFRMMNITVLPTMFDDVLDPMGIAHLCKWRSSDKILTLPWGSTIIFASAEKPDRLRGPNLCWGIMDEATIFDKFNAAYVSVNTRLRHPKATRFPETGKPLFHLGITGTPEGRLDEVYERFIGGPERDEQRERWRHSTQTIQSASMDNPGLDQSFIDELFNIVSEDMRDAHIFGKYIDLSAGRAYYSFNEQQNVRSEAKYDPTLPLRVSFDFNVDPMLCTIHQVRGSRLVMTIDEIHLRRSNTPNVCREIIKRYGRNGLDHRGRIIIYGDATGGRTTADRSDYDVILEYLGNYFGLDRLQKKVPNVNPSHQRRLHSVNAMLRNSQGSVCLIVHPRCKKLIRDLKLQAMDGVSKHKKQEIEGETLGHASDTLDYIIDKEFPYKRPNSRVNFKKTKLNAWYESPIS